MLQWFFNRRRQARRQSLTDRASEIAALESDNSGRLESRVLLAASTTPAEVDDATDSDQDKDSESESKTPSNGIQASLSAQGTTNATSHSMGIMVALDSGFQPVYENAGIALGGSESPPSTSVPLTSGSIVDQADALDNFWGTSDLVDQALTDSFAPTMPSVVDQLPDYSTSKTALASTAPQPAAHEPSVIAELEIEIPGNQTTDSVQQPFTPSQLFREEARTHLNVLANGLRNHTGNVDTAEPSPRPHRHVIHRTLNPLITPPGSQDWFVLATFPQGIRQGSLNSVAESGLRNTSTEQASDRSSIVALVSNWLESTRQKAEFFRRSQKDNRAATGGQTNDLENIDRPYADFPQIPTREETSDQLRHLWTGAESRVAEVCDQPLLSDSPPEPPEMLDALERLQYQRNPRGPPDNESHRSSELQRLYGRSSQLEQLRHQIAPRGPSLDRITSVDHPVQIPHEAE